jgi:hypothetical protein
MFVTSSAGVTFDIILGGQDGLVNVLGVILGVAAQPEIRTLYWWQDWQPHLPSLVSMGAVAYTSTMADADFYESERERDTAYR